MWVILPNIIREINMNQVTQANQQVTMSSSQLSELLLNAKQDEGISSSSYDKKEVNRKIRDMFQAEIDGGKIPSSLDSRGYVIEYHLNELHSTMFVGKWHTPFLKELAQFWIDRKRPQPKSQLQVLHEITSAMIEQEKSLHQLESQVTHIGSEVDLIKNKLDNTYWFAYCFLTVVTVAGEHPTSAATFLTLNPESNADIIFSCNS